jgi:hypothetical protein
VRVSSLVAHWTRRKVVMGSNSGRVKILPQLETFILQLSLFSHILLGTKWFVDGCDAIWSCRLLPTNCLHLQGTFRMFVWGCLRFSVSSRDQVSGIRKHLPVGAPDHPVALTELTPIGQAVPSPPLVTATPVALLLRCCACVCHLKHKYHSEFRLEGFTTS